MLILNQNQRVNDVIGQVRCTSRGDVRYEILAFNPPDVRFLSVDANSGELTLVVEAITLNPSTYRVDLRCVNTIS